MVRLGRWLLYGAVGTYLLLPVLAVALYSLATSWTANPLPDGYTLANWAHGLADPRLQAAVLRTFLLALAVLALDVLIVVPAVYWQRVRNPRIRIAAELCAAIPFVLPFIVIAFGILKLAGFALPELLGTPPLLLLGHAAIAFPFLYWAVDGAMAAANIVKLDEAAQASGATPLQTLRHVVFPNISAGLATGGMLVFATSFGEFALAQILVGARFENVSLLSLDLLSRTSADFGMLAVLTVITFLVLFAISAGVVWINRGQGGGMVAGARQLVLEKDA